MEIKDIIKNRRLELGLTMKELAAKIGVSESAVSRWESGNISNMKRDKVALLSRVLGISPDVLMGWETDEAPNDHSDEYLFDDDAKELAQFLFDHPEYKSVFDAVRKVKKDDIQFVKDFMERVSGSNG